MGMVRDAYANSSTLTIMPAREIIDGHKTVRPLLYFSAMVHQTSATEAASKETQAMSIGRASGLAGVVHRCDEQNDEGDNSQTCGAGHQGPGNFGDVGFKHWHPEA